MGVTYVSTRNRDSKLLTVGVDIPETKSLAISDVNWFANDLLNAVDLPFPPVDLEFLTSSSSLVPSYFRP